MAVPELVQPDREALAFTVYEPTELWSSTIGAVYAVDGALPSNEYRIAAPEVPQEISTVTDGENGPAPEGSVEITGVATRSCTTYVALTTALGA